MPPGDAGGEDAGVDGGLPAGDGVRFRVLLDDPVFPEGQDRPLHVGLVWFDALGDPVCEPSDAGVEDAAVADAGVEDAGGADAGPAVPEENPLPPTGSIPGAVVKIGVLGTTPLTGRVPLPEAAPTEHIKPVDVDGDPCTPPSEDDMRVAFYLPVAFEDLDKDGELGDADDVVGFVSASGLPPRLPIVTYIERVNPLVLPGIRNGWNLLGAAGGNLEQAQTIDPDTEVQIHVTALPRLEGTVHVQLVDGDGDPVSTSDADALAIVYADTDGHSAPGPVIDLNKAGGRVEATLALENAALLEEEIPMALDLLSIGILFAFDDVNANGAYDPEPGPDKTVASSFTACPRKALVVWHRAPWFLKFWALNDPEAQAVPRRGYNASLLSDGLRPVPFEEAFELIDIATLPTDEAGAPILECPAR